MQNNQSISDVREITIPDIELIINYWTNASDEFLTAMGVDLLKMPGKEFWNQMLTEQLTLPYKEKKSYCIIWMLNGKPTGHSNVNKIIFGEEAYMHLHIWDQSIRQKGLGQNFINMTLPYFFEKLELKKIYCEPYALNPAPNKALKKAGFEFVKKYLTTPGFLNFEQVVNQWVMTFEKFTHHQ
jgi:RimJ/RimL family protein N-acetyltransferase